MVKTIGIISGTGLDNSLREIEGVQSEELGKGITILEYEGVRAFVLNRHDRGEGFVSPAELILNEGHRENILDLYSNGVDAIYATSAVGTLDEEIGLVTDVADGVFVLPNQLRCWETGPITMGTRAKAIFPNMDEPFNAELAERLANAVENTGGKVFDYGLYLSKGGDAFETDAEIHMLQVTTDVYENRLLGMTGGPEAVLAAQMKIPYALICSVANYGQSIGPREEVTDELVRERMAFAKEKLPGIFLELILGYS